MQPQGITQFLKKYRGAVSMLVVAIVLIYLAAPASHSTRSSELAFTDASHSGLAIVPASCPSNPHRGEICGPTPSCTESGSCSCPTGYTYLGGSCIVAGCPPAHVCVVPPPGCGSGGSCSCPSGYTLEGAICVSIAKHCPPGDIGKYPKCVCVPEPVCAGSSIINVCTGAPMGNPSTCSLPTSAGCSAGRCLPPPPADIVTWSVKPTLLQSGKPAKVTWEANHVKSCTVTGTNGDGPWTGASGVQTSNPIIGQTIYTLSCVGFDSVTVTRTATVNIVPKFKEQ